MLWWNPHCPHGALDLTYSRRRGIRLQSQHSGEVGAEGSEVQGHSQPHSKLEASPGYMRPGPLKPTTTKTNTVLFAVKKAAPASASSETVSSNPR